MSCASFFQSHLNWLNQNTSGQTHFINFLMASGRNEANQFVLYATGSFALSGQNVLLATSAHVYFSDRLGNVGGNPQPFDATKSELETIKITLPNGPLQRLNSASGATIGTYESFECNANGLLVCTSQLTKEMLILSFKDASAPIPIQ